MKKVLTFIVFVVLIVSLVGCGDKGNNKDVKETIDGNVKTYSEMSDGTWCCDDVSYEYRLEIHGLLNNATVESVYVYLSNIEDISFEQAWKASGLSSNTNDYFAVEDAVLVECK